MNHFCHLSGMSRETMSNDRTQNCNTNIVFSSKATWLHLKFIADILF